MKRVMSFVFGLVLLFATSAFSQAPTGPVPEEPASSEVKGFNPNMSGPSNVKGFNPNMPAPSGDKRFNPNVPVSSGDKGFSPAMPTQSAQEQTSENTSPTKKKGEE